MKMTFQKLSSLCQAQDNQERPRMILKKFQQNLNGSCHKLMMHSAAQATASLCSLTTNIQTTLNSFAKIVNCQLPLRMRSRMASTNWSRSLRTLDRAVSTSATLLSTQSTQSFLNWPFSRWSRSSLRARCFTLPSTKLSISKASTTRKCT